MQAVVGEISAPDSTPLVRYAAKRVIDVVVAGIVVLLTAPVLLAAMVAIAVVSPGPPIFAQRRIGRHGREFVMYKLRTMHNGAHLRQECVRNLSEVDGPVLKIRRDPRLHALGAFLRRTSIDELPNFVNVLLGEMSVVGPRPPLACEVERYDAYALYRLRVKPGVTCLWQIRGRSKIGFGEWMRLDHEYIDTWSPLGDLKIIAATIPAVLRGDGAY